jgi:hypothetical protein
MGAWSRSCYGWPMTSARSSAAILQSMKSTIYNVISLAALIYAVIIFLNIASISLQTTAVVALCAYSIACAEIARR